MPSAAFLKIGLKLDLLTLVLNSYSAENIGKWPGGRGGVCGRRKGAEEGGVKEGGGI